MKYSLKPLIYRQIIGLIVLALATVLSKWLHPEMVELIVHNVEEILTLVFFVVLGVDIAVYNQNKAAKSS